MTDEQALISHIHGLPDDLKIKVARFVENLKKEVETETPRKRAGRKPGSGAGKYHIGPDFDTPLEEFEEYM